MVPNMYETSKTRSVIHCPGHEKVKSYYEKIWAQVPKIQSESRESNSHINRLDFKGEMFYENSEEEISGFFSEIQKSLEWTSYREIRGKKGLTLEIGERKGFSTCCCMEYYWEAKLLSLEVVYRLPKIGKEIQSHDRPVPLNNLTPLAREKWGLYVKKLPKSKLRDIFLTAYLDDTDWHGHVWDPDWNKKQMQLLYFQKDFSMSEKNDWCPYGIPILYGIPHL